MTTDIDGLKSRSLRALKWSALGEFLSVSLQPLITLILARILSPAEFGIVAIASLAVGFAQLFQEFGVGKTVVQAQDDDRVFLNTAFWMNFSLGIFLYAVLFSSAGILASFFGNPSAALIIRVLCLQLIINSACNVHTAILQRKLSYRPIFVTKLVSSIFSGVAAVLIALSGGGVWALVAGTLTASFFQCCLFWWFSAWVPGLRTDIKSFTRIFGFSRWILAEAVLAWCITSGDMAALGHYLGVEEMGIYRISTYIIMFVSYCFMAPAVPVSFSLLSRLQDNMEEFTAVFTRISSAVTALCLPVGFGIAILSKPIVALVLGVKWSGAEVIVAILAVRFGIDWVFGLLSTVFSALGKPKINAVLLVICCIITIPAYIVSAPLGLIAFTCTRLATSLVMDLIGYAAVIRTLKISWSNLGSIVRVPFLGVALMLAVEVLFARYVPIRTVPLLVTAVVVGATTYIGSIYILDRNFLTVNYRHLREIFR